MVFCEDRPRQNADEPSVHRTFRGRESAHLMADTHEELVEYANKIKLKLNWIQKEGQWDEHFDIVGQFLQRVQRDHRVKKLSRTEFVERLRVRRAAAILLKRGLICL